MPSRVKTNMTKPKTTIIHIKTLAIAATLALLTVGTARAQIADRPAPGPELKKLEIHVGDWKYEGTLQDTPLGPGGKFTGKSSTKWVLDGLFQESHAEDKGVYGGKPMTYKSVWYRGYDATSKTYIDHSFNNDGFTTVSTVTVNGDSWTTTSTGTDSKGKTFKTRETTTFAADGRSSTSKSEYLAENGTWKPFYELTSKKTSK